MNTFFYRSFFIILITLNNFTLFAQPKYALEISQSATHYFQGNYMVFEPDEYQLKPGYASALHFYYTPKQKNSLFVSFAFVQMNEEWENELIAPGGTTGQMSGQSQQQKLALDVGYRFSFLEKRNRYSFFIQPAFGLMLWHSVRESTKSNLPGDPTATYDSREETRRIERPLSERLFYRLSFDLGHSHVLWKNISGKQLALNLQTGPVLMLFNKKREASPVPQGQSLPENFFGVQARLGIEYSF